MEYIFILNQMPTARGLTPNTVRSYQTYLLPYLDFLSVHSILPEDASWQDMRDFLSFIQKSRSLSDRTVNMIISYLQFFQLYVLHKGWDRTQIPFRRFDTFLPFVPSRTQVAQFLSSISDKKVRLDELCHLHCKDIISSSKKIHIRRSKNHTDRYVPMPDSIWKMILDYWYSFPKGMRPKEWLFTQQHSLENPMDKQWIQKKIQQQRIRLGIDGRLTAHPFRHAYATHSYENGMDLPTLQAFMGHNSIDSTIWEVYCMANRKVHNILGFSASPAGCKHPKIQEVFWHSYAAYCKSHIFQSAVRKKAAHDILGCKTGKLGYSTSICTECGHLQIHNNSCRKRNCPCCQAALKEVWVDQRGAEVIDAPYFHIVFTLPHELNPLLYSNQKLLYGLFHRCCAKTLLELSADQKYLGAVPGIIQVLHTWNQEIKYHVHMHCIVSGGGLTKDHKIRRGKNKFFIPVAVLRDKLKGKSMSCLDSFYQENRLELSASCEKLRNSYEWKEFKNSLYEKDWCPYIKETFNGFGNAIEYLGRYAYKTAISNSRILSVSETETVFSARGKRPGDPRRETTLGNAEFIRRFLMHYKAEEYNPHIRYRPPGRDPVQ